MLCSVSTTGKSSAGTTWLDRLHTSKGFPRPPPDLNLDHFLNRPNPNPDATIAPPRPDAASPRQKTRSEKNGEKKDQKEEFFDLMSCALAKLFRMGDPGEYDRIRDLGDKKNTRKQLHPKVCVLSAPGSDGGSFPVGERGVCGAPAALSPPSAENSTVEVKKRSSAGAVKKGRKRAACGDALVDPELASHSRIEVTVIDMSCEPDWKSKKLIFRKGSVWKIRDKKFWNLSRKNGKLSSADGSTEQKDSDQKLPESNEFDKHEHLAFVNEESPDNLKHNSPKVTNNDQNSIPKRRRHLSRSSHKPAPKDTLLHSRNAVSKKRRA